MTITKEQLDQLKKMDFYECLDGLKKFSYLAGEAMALGNQKRSMELRERVDLFYNDIVNRFNFASMPTRDFL